MCVEPSVGGPDGSGTPPGSLRSSLEDSGDPVLTLYIYPSTSHTIAARHTRQLCWESLLFEKPPELARATSPRQLARTATAVNKLLGG